jgi:hypothetical protein
MLVVEPRVEIYWVRGLVVIRGPVVNYVIVGSTITP